MLLYGLSAVLIGPTLPGMISSFDLSLSEAGFISSAQNAGGFLGALVSLWIADRVSHPRTALLAFVLIAVATFAVGIAGRYGLVLVAFGFTGLFIRILDVMLNAHTGEIAGTRSGRSMTTLHMFFSIGAFVGPIVARALMGAGIAWSDVYRSVGGGYLLVVVVSVGWLRAYARSSPEQEDADPAPGEAMHTADVPASAPAAPTFAAIGLLGTALFFYAIHQVGITSWVPYFLEASRGASADIASIGLSAYWIGIIGGRFGASRLVERLGAARLLVIGAIVSAAATLGAVLFVDMVLVQALLVIAGISSGATIPLAYTVGFSFLPSRRGSVTAAMSLVMLAGRFLGPWMIGVLADRSNLVIAMTVPGLALFFTALAAALVYLVRRRGLASATRI